MKRQCSAEQAPPVVGQLEAERLGKSSRTSCDLCGGRVGRKTAKCAHFTESFEGLRRAEKDSGRAAGLCADDVHAGMDPVAAISVEPTGRTEHRAVAGCRTSMGMGRSVAAIPEVGLDLDDPDHEPHPGIQSANQATPDQVAGDASTVPRVESEAKRWAEGHPASIGKSIGDARFASGAREPTRSAPRTP